MSPRRRRRARARRRRNGTVRIVAGLAGGAALLALLGGALAMNAIGETLRDAEIREIALGENSRIYDRGGRQLGIIAGVTNRTEVPLSRIPKTLRDATVAVEDQRFYEHGGVDYTRVFGAALRNVESGDTSEGGSTITMQLARNLNNLGRDQTFSRKVTEAYLAFQYEKRFNKNQILSKYLNGVFYGHNAIGAQAAALTFFDRPIHRITLPQAALLAGLPQAPSRYSPFANPEVAKERRNEVLERMRDQGFITPEKAEKAMQSGLGIKRGDAYERKREGYFFDYVRELLIDENGEDEVQRGGFRVYTTIDPKLQRAAENAINEVLYLDDDPDAAIVMIDARTGFIRAMASSQEYGDDNQFNLAAQALRQSGSTFKTFVLTKAVEEGINPATTFYESKRLNFTDPVYGRIDVSTYSNSYRGVIPVSSATLSSDNSVYTQLTMDVGPGEVKELAERMGIPKERGLQPFPSIGLGAGDVTPLDMAVAYAPLANGGTAIEPVAVSRIERGDKVTKFRTSRKRVFGDGVAYEVTRILRANITGGTGGRANIGVPQAGKTGTTDNFVDAWFVGYTPRYVTAVWVGYPNNDGVKRQMRGVHGINVAGGTFPAEIWGKFMRVAVGNNAPDFPAPSNPVSWSPFSSDFIEAAGEAKRREEEEARSAAEEAEREKEQARSEREAARSERQETPPPPVQASPETPGAAPAPTPDPVPQPEPDPPAPEPTPDAPAPGPPPPTP